MTVDGLLGVHCTTGSVDEEVFCDVIEWKLLPQLMPFNGVNARSFNYSIHHTSRAIGLVQSTGALLHFLPTYSPHLSPIEELFSKVKSCLKENDRVMEIR